MSFQPKGQIMGGGPNALSNPIGRRGLAMLICIGSLVVGGLEEARVGLVPGGLAGVDEGLN